MQPRKVLTPEQMRAVDAATVEAGIPGIILMENAACAVVDFLAERFGPLTGQRIAVICGKGNNGGDGLAIARILRVRFRLRRLWVVLACEPSELKGDAAENLRMLQAVGISVLPEITPEMAAAGIVIDAVLGTGLNGPASGRALEAIRAINGHFPLAEVVAVDLPSGLSGATGAIVGEYVRADATVTFTAPKVCHAMAPAANCMGELRIAGIGSRPEMYEDDEAIRLALVTPESIAPVFAPRNPDGNKGRYGHVLIVAGSRGKSGAAAMAAMGALRAGAGLVTVACPVSALDAIASTAPEIMTEPLRETDTGQVAAEALERILELAAARSVVAIGPGLGQSDDLRTLTRGLFASLDKPLVVDADALNCLVGSDWKGEAGVRVLTPHPGEMSRLTGASVAEIQADRINAARTLAAERNSTVVLKGERTLIAFSDGRVWVNPTGSPAMATGGTGDILTGMTAGLLGQFPKDWERAVAAAVYLHGRAGELAGTELGEQPVIATDLLRFIPGGIRDITNLAHEL